MIDKKKVILFLIITVVISINILGIDSITLKFIKSSQNSENIYLNFNKGSIVNIATKSLTENVIEAVPENEDPQIVFEFDKEINIKNISFDMEVQKEDFFQVFYMIEGSNTYSEVNSKKINLSASQNNYNITFSIFDYPEKVKKIRIDPVGNVNNRFKLSNILIN